MEFRSILKFACQLGESQRAGTCAREFLQKAGCVEPDVVDCELAVVEACNNAIKYAGPSGRRLPVIVKMMCDPDLIEFQIIDHTPGFKWPRRAGLPPAESESGRGIYLIQSVMDSADYLRGPQENTLVLRRLRVRCGVPSTPAR